MRNISGLLMLLLVLGGCTAQIKVMQSTSQVWRGGVEGAGGGKNYVVTLTKPSKTTIEIEQVWVGQREKGWLPRFQVSPQPNDTANYHVAHAGITEFSVKFAENYPGHPMPRNSPQPVAVVPFDQPPHDLPEAFTHGAVIYFKTNSSRGTWIVADFESLPVLNYP